MNSLRRLLLIVVASMALAKTACSVDDATTILIDDTVLVADCQRFGINLGGDKYHSGAALVKKRTTQNFEGVSYRQCHYGPFQDEQGAATWFSLSDTWQDILIGGRYTVLTGPAKGRSGTIVDVATRTAKHEGKTEEFSLRS